MCVTIICILQSFLLPENVPVNHLFLLRMKVVLHRRTCCSYIWQYLSSYLKGRVWVYGCCSQVLIPIKWRNMGMKSLWRMLRMECLQKLSSTRPWCDLFRLYPSILRLCLIITTISAATSSDTFKILLYQALNKGSVVLAVWSRCYQQRFWRLLNLARCLGS